MADSNRWRAWGLAGAGLALGLVIGGAMVVGVLLARHDAAGFPALEELKLKAMASHGSDTFAIATGPVDEEVEGLFTLDFLTGDLQCFVVNARAASPGGWFKTNIAKDLNIEKGKKPNYLLVTGNINSRGAAGNARPASSLVYVVDANSGDAACYTFLWSKAYASTGAAQMREMTLVNKWKVRTLTLRD